jgi:hypothetical protein
VILDRENADRPVLFAQFDQPLDQPDRILEQHVRVNHPMQDQQRPLQAFGEINRRALAVGLRIVLRFVQDVRGVVVVVMRPVGHRPQRRTGRECVGRREHRHQRDEATIAAAVDTDALRVDLLNVGQIFRAVHDIIQIFAAHVTVNRGSPIAAIARAGTVVGIEHDIPVGRQQVVEHVFTEVAGPVLVRVLGVTRAVDEHHRRRIGIALRASHFRGEQPRVDLDAIARFVSNQLRIDPLVRTPLISRRRGDLFRRRAW